MAKKKPKEEMPKKWYLAFDEAEIRDATNEATVDAYGEAEEHSGFLSTVDECLETPFSARALGMDVIVTDVLHSDEDPFAIDFQLTFPDGSHHRLDVRFVEPKKPLPEGHIYLAAYMKWRSRLG
jgi:hypothetical protein